MITLIQEVNRLVNEIENSNIKSLKKCDEILYLIEAMTTKDDGLERPNNSYEKFVAKVQKQDKELDEFLKI